MMFMIPMLPTKREIRANGGKHWWSLVIVPTIERASFGISQRNRLPAGSVPLPQQVGDLKPCGTNGFGSRPPTLMKLKEVP